MERFRAKMAGPIARRHSDRARTFLVLFSHRYLHCSKRCLEFAFFALLNFPALKATRGRVRTPKASRNTSRACFISHEVLWSAGRLRTAFGIPYDQRKSAGTNKPAR